MTGKHIAMSRDSADGTDTLLTLRTICTQAKILGEDFLAAHRRFR
jgi:hypothetical protein